MRRPRVRARDGHEMPPPSGTAAGREDRLGRWVLNLMLINVSTRNFGRAVRLGEGDLPARNRDGTSTSAAARRFAALSAAKMAEGRGADRSTLDLLVLQLDGLHIGTDHVMVAALGNDGGGDKHPLALLDGATENAVTIQALLDVSIERGLGPTICRLFMVDGAKALTRAIRNTFGKHTPIPRRQIHKARNIPDRLPEPLRPALRRGLRQGWELDDADTAERLLRNLVRRLDREGHGVANSILEGIDEMPTVTRLGLPDDLRRSLAVTNIIEHMMGTVRRVCHDVRRWRSAEMALRWTAAGLLEAENILRRLKAYRQLPILRQTLEADAAKAKAQGPLVATRTAA